MTLMRARSSSVATRVMGVIGTALLGCVPASGWANIVCSGNIALLGVDSSGNVAVSIGYGTWTVCNTTQPFTGNSVTVAPDACKMWYASFLAAQRAQAAVAIYFPGSTPCGAWGNWVTAVPYFVQPE